MWRTRDFVSPHSNWQFFFINAVLGPPLGAIGLLIADHFADGQSTSWDVVARSFAIILIFAYGIGLVPAAIHGAVMLLLSKVIPRVWLWFLIVPASGYVSTVIGVWLLTLQGGRLDVGIFIHIGWIGAFAAIAASVLALLLRQLPSPLAGK